MNLYISCLLLKQPGDQFVVFAMEVHCQFCCDSLCSNSLLIQVGITEDLDYVNWQIVASTPRNYTDCTGRVCTPWKRQSGNLSQFTWMCYPTIFVQQCVWSVQYIGFIERRMIGILKVRWYWICVSSVSVKTVMHSVMLCWVSEGRLMLHKIIIYQPLKDVDKGTQI